jgi:hypothetical protein
VSQNIEDKANAAEARIIFRTPDNSELETATIPKLEK